MNCIDCIHAGVCYKVNDFENFPDRCGDAISTSLLRPSGYWIVCYQDNDGIHKIECPFCKYKVGSEFGDRITMVFHKLPNYCEQCGAELHEVKENETDN